METQESIQQWAIAAFGFQAHPRTIAARVLEELAELFKAMDEDGNVVEEVADVAICLNYLAASLGCDLQKEIDSKMAINRKREWVTNGRGTGYHRK